jgi:hypothetical protein
MHDALAGQLPELAVPPLGILLAERTTAVAIAVWIDCLLTLMNREKSPVGGAVYPHAVGAVGLLSKVTSCSRPQYARQ